MNWNQRLQSGLRGSRSVAVQSMTLGRSARLHPKSTDRVFLLCCELPRRSSSGQHWSQSLTHWTSLSGNVSVFFLDLRSTRIARLDVTFACHQIRAWVHCSMYRFVFSTLKVVLILLRIIRFLHLNADIDDKLSEANLAHDCPTE